MRNVLLSVLLSCAACIAVCATLWAATPDLMTTDDPRSLELEHSGMVGLSRIKVLVSDIDDSFSNVGLTSTSARTCAELRLRRAGIKVVPESQQDLTARSPWLRIQIGGGSGGRPSFSFSVIVDLVQNVRPVGTATVVQGATWHRNVTGWAGREGCKEYIQAALEGIIDEFANTFLTANPVATTTAPQRP